MGCPVDGCTRPTLIRSTGLCDAHRQRARRHGSPTGGGVSRKVDPMVRVVEQTREDPSGCLLWAGSVVRARRSGMEYGRTKVDGRSTLVHRYVWERSNGRQLAPGEVVRHTCDVSLCVHPGHLLVGSHQDNVDDCIARGRAWWQKVTRDLQPTSA